MPKKTNIEVTKALINEVGGELKDSLTNVITESEANGLSPIGVSRAVSTHLFGYQALKNSFIDALINKVFMSRFWSKVWENPLKVFVDGRIDYGATIEDLYVEASEGINYEDNFNGGTPEKNVLGTLKNNIYTNYLSVNFKKKFKTSINDVELRRAFTNEYGLGDLISQLLVKNIRGMFREEYKLIKDMLFKYLSGISSKDVGMGVNDTATQFIQDSQVVRLSGRTTKDVLTDLLTKVRIYGEKFEFESDKYNSAKVQQFSPMGDTVFVTTPDVYGTLDVQKLADTFHIEKAEIRNRIILIDELPAINTVKSGDTGGTTYATEKPVGLLMDSRLIQLKTQVLENRVFENPDTLVRNHFLHFQGLVGVVPFLNCVVFMSSETEF